MPVHVRMNYMNDTFFGPISKSIDCEITIIPITPGAFQVRMFPPVPDDLHKAHTVTIMRSSQPPLTGTVVDARRMDNGELELQIDV
ncbi:hypothetical protein BJ917_0289 [Pseudomonas sp. WPR_5_2]|nr:hypothetical protein BJ917_0289 [Pseudomonas sp. WPR_5_2]